MDIEAKLTNQELKKRLFVFEWDRTKYRFIVSRIRYVVAAVFAFFLGCAFFSVLEQAEVPKSKSEVASTFDIPSASEELSTVAKPKAGITPQSKTQKRIVYTGPEVISRESASIPPGTLLKAKLITGASNGPVQAKLLQDIVIQGEVLIDSGSVLVGQGNSTEDRLFISFNRLVKKDGTSLQIQAQAIDQSDRIVGLRGNKVGSELLKLGAGIGLNFIGGMSEALQDTEVKGMLPVKKSSMKNALLNGASYAALEQSKEAISSFKESAPRVEVEKGKPILVMTE